MNQIKSQLKNQLKIFDIQSLKKITGIRICRKPLNKTKMLKVHCKKDIAIIIKHTNYSPKPQKKTDNYWFKKRHENLLCSL